ncbi:E3 ubiquitin-protein ligase RMA1H1 [Linum perenne]
MEENQLLMEDFVAGNDKIRRSDSFDCNICLDPVHDPVVTLCGHLYCWPCIYRWLHSSAAAEEEEFEKPVYRRQCPVCKSEISQSALIPLFGRGQGSGGNNSSTGDVIPRRPSAPPPETIFRRQSRRRGLDLGMDLQQRRYYDGGLDLGLSGRVPIPVVGMLEEIVFSGGGETAAFRVAGGGRARRQMVEADRSLGRVCFFLCCCVFMCILLF